MIGEENNIYALVRNILAYNTVQIDDGDFLSRELNQTNEVLQEDPASPILFNVATAHVIKIIDTSVSHYTYTQITWQYVLQTKTNSKRPRKNERGGQKKMNYK